MSFPKNNQDLRVKITGFDVANMCSRALRKEHQNDTSCVKHIQAKTQISENTISKWYRALNAPKTPHFLVLATNYPEVLKGLLLMIGREDVWRYCLLKNIPSKMTAVTGENTEDKALYSDKYVHIDVVLKKEIVAKVNQRQLWFLGELQNGQSIPGRQIAKIWKKSQRTARRDIQAMLNLGLIAYCGSPKNGHYILLE